MIIETERLRLRPLAASDADWICTEIANPEVQRWLTSPPHPYTLADAKAFISEFGAAPGFRSIEYNGEPLGVISIESEQSFAEDRPNLPGLGYWLKQAAWGRGYMTEAATALLHWHDVTIGGPVYSGFVDGNVGSARVLDKVGFVPFKKIERWSEFLGHTVPIQKVLRAAP